MPEEQPKTPWLERFLQKELPNKIADLKQHTEPNANEHSSWLHTVVVDVALHYIGDLGADLRDKAARFETWLDSLSNTVDAQEVTIATLDEADDDHDERIAALESFVDALGQVTQLLPDDADDIAKLAASAKWIATEVLTKGEQTDEGRDRLADLIALCDKVSKLAETARVDVSPPEADDEEDEDEEPETAEPTPPN